MSDNATKKGEEMAQTLRFSATFGVVAGYGHSNENLTPAAAQSIVAEAWQKAAAVVFADRGIYVSSVVVPSKTVYHTDWGCPVGGEVTAAVSGEANPEFTPDMAAWKEAVVAVAKLVKAELQQSTVSLTFSQVDDFVYLAD